MAEHGINKVIYLFDWNLLPLLNAMHDDDDVIELQLILTSSDASFNRVLSVVACC